MTKKYAALERFLHNCDRDRIALSFVQIENELRIELPKSARSRPEWWGNNPEGHVQAQAWLNAGYRVRADRVSEIAYFERDHN